MYAISPAGRARRVCSRQAWGPSAGWRPRRAMQQVIEEPVFFVPQAVLTGADPVHRDRDPAEVLEEGLGLLDVLRIVDR